MLSLLAVAVLALAAADHWTTYLCLRETVPGFTVSEANPLAAWLFAELGLVPGLLLDSLVTLGGVGFLLVTRRIPDVAKALFLIVVGLWTVGAVTNNLLAIEALGLVAEGPF